MKEQYLKTNFGKMYLYLLDRNNKKTIVWLHGWGMSGKEFNNFGDELLEYNHLFLDLMGFGKSEEPCIAMTLDDYVLILKNIIETLELEDIYLVGHSFGGRIAISYASQYQNESLKKVFLVSAKAFKNKSIKCKLKIIGYKIKKKFYFIFNKKRYHQLINNSGSSDYKSATKIMKETLKNIVNKDLKKELQEIKCKCIVLGSVNDRTVDYHETLKIYHALKISKIYPFYQANHFLYKEERTKFIKILYKELGSN